MRCGSIPRVTLRLQPMWRVLTSAVPDVMLGSTEDLAGNEREHRMRIECEDALLRLLPWLPAPGLDPDESPAVRAAAIADALESYGLTTDPVNHGGVQAPPRWLTDEDEFLRVADAWTTLNRSG
ncbi:DUF6545 domain-containing protein [Rhodococcus marinonascens]|uniref:DUF6545 domain-containing protein n=1 Tax=Rhodococcus marinonascens TaxID=38311 RepID=UPI0027D8DA87|nr:DUF6545 domain-containing protein [Rhodococcus marinonascens]